MNNRIEELPEKLEKGLSHLIRDIAKEHNISKYVQDQDFLEKRLHSWHQFGLLTHTKKVREVFLNELDSLLQDWKVYGSVKKELNRKVHGVKKSKLLEISMPLHDLGKILCYGDSRTNREHEKLSGFLMETSRISDLLDQSGLSSIHRSYIREYVETHDLIGKRIRDELKHEGKLRLDFLSNNEVKEKCRRLGDEQENIKFELGVYFLCDLLGKTDIRIEANNDAELVSKENWIEKTLSDRNLYPELKKAVLQLPVNIGLAKEYFFSLIKGVDYNAI